MRHVFLIAGEPVERFGHYDVEALMSRVFQQLLVPGAEP